MIKKVDTMIRFVSSKEECRSTIILKYFGENNALDCNMCDICVENKDDSKRIKQLQKLVLNELKESNSSIETLGVRLYSNKKVLLKAIQLLIDENKMKLNDSNEFEII